MHVPGLEVTEDTNFLLQILLSLPSCLCHRQAPSCSSCTEGERTNQKWALFIHSKRLNGNGEIVPDLPEVRQQLRIASSHSILPFEL